MFVTLINYSFEFVPVNSGVRAKSMNVRRSENSSTSSETLCSKEQTLSARIRSVAFIPADWSWRLNPPRASTAVWRSRAAFGSEFLIMLVTLVVPLFAFRIHLEENTCAAPFKDLPMRLTETCNGLGAGSAIA